MRKYQHHPDGWIILENASAQYMDTPENLAIDSGLQPPKLPAGAVSVLYIEGRFNAAFDAEGNQYGNDEYPLSEYIALIDATETLASAKAQREAEAAAEATAEAAAAAE